MITPKQEKFVQGLISGLSQRQAYKEAYDTTGMKDETIDVRACKLIKEHKISIRYQELVDEHKEKALWTREEAVKELIWLKDVSKESIINTGIKQANTNAFANAIKELNTLEDLYKHKDAGDSENKQAELLATAIRELRGN